MIYISNGLLLLYEIVVHSFIHIHTLLSSNKYTLIHSLHIHCLLFGCCSRHICCVMLLVYFYWVNDQIHPIFVRSASKLLFLLSYFFQKNETFVGIQDLKIPPAATFFLIQYVDINVHFFHLSSSPGTRKRCVWWSTTTAARRQCCGSTRWYHSRLWYQSSVTSVSLTLHMSCSWRTA